MSRNTLQDLARKLDALISYNEQLKRDNALFKQREHQWQVERNRLIENNNLARGRVEAMITHLKTHKFAAHILDGPQGPIGKVKPGAIKIAHKSGALIVPFYVVADNAWYFNSWDGGGGNHVCGRCL